MQLTRQYSLLERVLEVALRQQKGDGIMDSRPNPNTNPNTNPRQQKGDGIKDSSERKIDELYLQVP